MSATCFPSRRRTYLLTRYTMENWRQLTWFPLWNAGMPYQNAYQPGLPMASAGLAVLMGISPALSYHATIAFFYCLGAVGMFFLGYKLSGRRDAGLLTALFFSLLSPSAFLSSVVATIWEASGMPAGFRHLYFTGKAQM